MSNSRSRLLLTGLTICWLGFATGCSSTVNHLPVYSSASAHSSAADNTDTSLVLRADGRATQPQLTMQYLGVGGYLFQYGADSIMTAPSFTNPGLLSVSLPVPIATDKALVDTLLPERAKQAELVLVGHSHYDHLMDVPYILQQHMPEATAVGSTTMANILRAALPERQVLDISKYAAVGSTPGTWLYNRSKRIRVMPIKSAHAPHFMGIKLMSGQYLQPLAALPSTANGWKEGQTYAYIIDFLDGQGQARYRIHYQDAASNSPAGLMPNMADSKVVDMAILCAAGFHEVDDYPEALLQQVQPDKVILGHWEDFFANQGSAARVVPMTNINDFIVRTEAVLPASSQWLLPHPFATFELF